MPCFTTRSVGSEAQANATARSLLNLRLRLSRSLMLVSVPNPALEPDDLIEVVFADGRREQHLVNAVSIDLAADGRLELATTSQYTPSLARSAATVAGAAPWQEP